MRYLKYTYVDAVTGISSTDAPAANGPVSPLVVDLQFGFALESEYPTSTPVMFGTFLDGTPIDVPGVLSELTEAEYQAALDAELLARSVKTMASWASQIAARRFQVETGGVTVEGVQINTERDSQSLLTGTAFAASIDPDYRIKWKAATGFVDLTGEQVMGIASQVRAFVQTCFNREAELLGAVADGSITAEMLEEGWPE